MVSCYRSQKNYSIIYPLPLTDSVLRQEGLQLMREGGKATLVIPSDLAYGDAGSGEVCSSAILISSIPGLLDAHGFFVPLGRSFHLELPSNSK